MIPRLIQVEGAVEPAAEGGVEGAVEAGAAFDAAEFESVVLLISTRTSAISDRFARPTWFLIEVAGLYSLRRDRIHRRSSGRLHRGEGAGSPTNCLMSIFTGAPW